MEAVEILGIEEVRRLRYITNALKLEIYKAKCQSPQVTELIHDYFKDGGRYLLTDIKTTIKRIYEECGIAHKNGSQHRPYVTTLTVTEPLLKVRKVY